MGFTTIEKLQKQIGLQGAVLEYKGFVMVARQKREGEVEAEIYEFIDSYELDGINTEECRLSQIEKAKIRFSDGGSAIEWCINKLK